MEEVLEWQRRGEEGETGDALGRGLQVGEMRESADRPGGALNMKRVGGRFTGDEGETV